MRSVALITSGKGGVGKSTLTAALGIAFANMGQRVCIMDMDIGLRGQDALLDLQDRVIYDFRDVLEDNCELDDALIPYGDSGKLCMLSAPQFSRVTDFSGKAVGKLMTRLRNSFDRILVDSPAGLEKGLRLSFHGPIDETYIVCTPDDLCIRDAERVSALITEKELPRPRLLVNRLLPSLVERGEMYKPDVIAQTLDLELAGVIPDDPDVYRALLQHLHFMQLDCEAREAVLRIARRMQGENVPFPDYGRKRSWLARLLRPGAKEVVRIDC